ncbi:BICD family-like cargo adapter 2 isoform X2 [Oryzias latipes]|uniref:BICD family-like cargo adapter 2 isoform X2 n=1 Tax=Oryzias latipes TaxID=8090 RepID=UPI0005CC649E|nr:BICD family-like cargo adapter 2 isoform X2 [Oryzias latipes]
MFPLRKTSLPSPTMEDSFFPLSSASPVSLSYAIPSSSPENVDSGGGMETDLILAAELGQALLEKNEELAASLEQRERDLEALQQEKHVLQRKLEMRGLESGQREAELMTDLATVRAELKKYLNEGRERRKDETEQMTQLASHNQRLVEQLAEAVTLEHSLRTELRCLREEMEESSFSRNISLTQLKNWQAENRVLKERLAHMEAQLKNWQEDSQRLRSERDGLKETVLELQSRLSEKEAEAKDALLAHSTVLQARDEEIQALKEKVQSQLEELESLRDELKSSQGGPEKPSYRSLESDLATVRQEKETLTQQLLNTIKQKVTLSQELEAWQEDMRQVISQQVAQHDEPRQERNGSFGLQRSKSLRLKKDTGKNFFSFFKDI